MVEISRKQSERRSRSTGRAANLAERIYLQIKNDIFDFRFLPGDRFTETEVADRMGVSRTPVREALFRLQRENYVDVLYRNGWQVRPFNFEYFEDLYDVRTVLECAAVKRICDRDEVPAQLNVLKEVWLVPEDEMTTDVGTLSALDEQFHEMLVEAAGNGEMVRIHRSVSERIRIIRRLDFTRKARIDATYSEHAKILRAVIQRRADQAQMMLKAHIEASRNEVRKITLHMLHSARIEAGTDK
ncbi:GntR family transcriptional regulator [Alcanivorax sp. 1008]|uniref:GntR family transcriptional regulator n=1 Tax=Alcanivorax sp. 1008 TaxID=2816853 RepID=UPI001E08F531|nr:GntR family transcriptional regulator [Alcanivorax sp. 1008]MCC1496526.1 GntR family transcriptional regulator [Alcanivorax sp. 1008]